MRNKLIALLGMAAILGILAGLMVIPRMMWGGGSVASWLIHVEAGTLVERSDRILIANYADDQKENILKGTDADGESKGSISERFRQFTVVEVLKGGGSADDTLYVVTTESSKLRFADGKSADSDYEVLGLKDDVDYVLFLKGVNRPDGYPVDYGDVLWTSPGEPNIAEIGSDGKLSFLATQVYRDMIADAGLTPVSGSAAPFALTKADIKRMVGK